MKALRSERGDVNIGSGVGLVLVVLVILIFLIVAGVITVN